MKNIYIIACLGWIALCLAVYAYDFTPRANINMTQNHNLTYTNCVKFDAGGAICKAGVKTISILANETAFKTIGNMELSPSTGRINITDNSHPVIVGHIIGDSTKYGEIDFYNGAGQMIISNGWGGGEANITVDSDSGINVLAVDEINFRVNNGAEGIRIFDAGTNIGLISDTGNIDIRDNINIDTTSDYKLGFFDGGGTGYNFSFTTSGENFALRTYPQNVISLVISKDGAIRFPQETAGDALDYVCVDGSGNIIIQDGDCEP